MADNPRPNEPASGAYGEKKEMEGLKRSLPSSGGAGPGAPAAVPQQGTPVERPMGRPPGGAPPGVPQPIMDQQAPLAPQSAPDGQRDIASEGRLLQQAVPQMSEVERLILFLDVLSSSPGVTGETREWADLLLRVLVGESE